MLKQVKIVEGAVDMSPSAFKRDATASAALAPAGCVGMQYSPHP